MEVTILEQWLGRVVITAVVAGTAVVFVRGWRYLRHRDATPDSDILAPTSIHALVTFLSGLLLLLAAIIPLNQLATRYFTARCIQHLLLTAWVPSLLWVANPLPALFSGLPASWQQHIRHARRHHPGFALTMRQLTSPGLVWIGFIATFWLWYDPGIHQATLVYGWIRPFEIISLFGTSMIYWWHIMAALPLWHQPMPPLVRIFYALLGSWPVKIVGLIVILANRPIYAYPHTFRLNGLDINDQAMGGIVIWIMGGIVFTFTASMLMRRWLEKEELKPIMPLALWATEDALKAPHRK